MADNNSNELDALMISELPTQATANETDLFEVAIVDANSASGYASKKESAAAIADAIIGEYQYPLRITGTTAKTIAGAINELKNLVDLLPQFAIEVVQTLPVSDISTTTIYLVPAQDPEQGNYYEEYIYVNNAWELVGTTAVDLSGYYTSAQVDTLLAAKANTSSLATVATSGAYSDLSGKPTIDTALDTTSTNAVENRAVASEINSIKSDMQDKADIITNSASGAIASFSDGADNLPVKDLIIDIKAVQAGSGDPSPTNIRPISGWTGCNVARTGVNAWDEVWELGGIDVTTGINYASSNNIRSKNYIPIKPNTSYYIKGQFDAVIWYDINKAFISTSYSGGSKTSPNNAYFVRFYCPQSYGTTYNNDISINYPSTDTAYHAYTGTTINIDWEDEAGTIYGGTLNLTTGVLTVTDKLSIIDENSDIIKAATTDNIFYLRDFFEVDTGVGSNLSNVYTRGISRGSLVSVNENNPDFSFCGFTTSVKRLVIKDSRFSTLQEYKTWLSNNPVQIVQKLATPVTYQLTPVEVKTFLGQNNIWADTGDSSVSYRADTKKYIDAKIAELQALILNS